MSAVDFEAWALPPLVLTLGGRTYTVQPPSVEDAKKIIAAAVRGEVRLGLVKGPIPAEVQRVLDTIGPDEHPALGADVWQQMVDDGVLPPVRDRMAYYAVFYWAKGKQYADWLAEALWAPHADAAAEAPAPKAQPTSRRRSGPRTGSASRSVKTTTASPSTPTTASPPQS